MRNDRRILRESLSCLLVSLAFFAGCGPDSEPADGTSPATSAEGGAGSAAQSSESPLAGTHWQLVQFESMDDATGILAPEDPTQFTMTLAPDGSVSMQLGCNRANGTWSAEPSADGSSGGFTLGPLAMTRALCPPPNLDERIARDAEFVRSYLLRDGRLHLSLMADAGIYSWEPDASIHARAEPDARLEDALRRASPDYRASVVGDGPEGRYAWATVDLDGDGTDEVFAYALGPFFCGSGGCTLHVFRLGDDGEYAPVATFPISRLPVLVAEESSGGWRDLYRRESGGGASPSLVRHVYEGDTYVERERITDATGAPQGVLLLTGDVSYESGHPLEPAAD